MKKRASVQAAFVDLDAIRDDVVCLSHQRFRALLEVGAIGFGIQGEREQEATLASFAAFLNSLTFPIQIVVWPAPIDVTGYLDDLERSALNLPAALAQVARDHSDYFNRLARSRTLLQRRFYVVVPAGADGERGRSLWPWRRRYSLTFDEACKALTFRCEEVARELGRCSLSVRRLSTLELAQLFQACWSPDQSRVQRLQHDLADYTSLVLQTPAREGP